MKNLLLMLLGLFSVVFTIAFMTSALTSHQEFEVLCDLDCSVFSEMHFQSTLSASDATSVDS